MALQSITNVPSGYFAFAVAHGTRYQGLFTRFDALLLIGHISYQAQYCLLLFLDLQKKFSVRSDRVKCVDLHPSEPWILVSLYNGNIYIYNYQTQVRSFTSLSFIPTISLRHVY